jgi:acyl-CoA thioesterase I
MQLQELLRKTHPKITVVAAGSSGATSAGAESRLRWHLKNKPDILVLALGANDGLRGLPVESTKDNLAKAIELAQENKVTVLLAGMKMPMNYGEDYRQRYEKIFSELAEEKNVKLIPFLLEGVGGEKDMNLADGIHPNEKGHRQIAEHLHKYIKESL